MDRQKSISLWAEETFGPVRSNTSIAVRANVEMAELLRALARDDNSPYAAEEIADVVILFYRLAEKLGVDLEQEVDRKLEICRGREWVLDKRGFGQHVK